MSIEFHSQYISRGFPRRLRINGKDLVFLSFDGFEAMVRRKGVYFGLKTRTFRENIRKSASYRGKKVSSMIHSNKTPLLPMYIEDITWPRGDTNFIFE